jgi:hypothetical protein
MKSHNHRVERTRWDSGVFPVTIVPRAAHAGRLGQLAMQRGKGQMNKLLKFVFGIFIFTLLVCSCGKVEKLTPEEAKALQFELEAKSYRDKSIPENVAGSAAMRALLPPDATYHPYHGIKDSWVVSKPLKDVLVWYKKEMSDRGFEPTLRQCSTGSIWGGRVLIIDYCSETHYAAVTMGEDTRDRVTAVMLQYSARSPSLNCRTLVPAEARRVWTANCPADLLP